MVRIAINGFGRIGRIFFRAAFKEPGIEIVAVNDLADAKTMAHLLKYDSVHGKFDAKIEVKSEGEIVVNAKSIRIFTETGPEKLPWKKLAVDVVVESTGVFRKRAELEKHLIAGAKKVVLSAPAKDEIKTIVLGLNDSEIAQGEKLYSMASCTTNCLAPVAKVLDREFKIVSGLMNTVHAYTNDQRTLDVQHKDLRRARAAALSIIPTTTGATKAVALALPQLKGKMDGVSLRVPVPCGSITDFVCLVEKKPTIESVNSALKRAAQSELKGIMAFSEEPLVSADIIGNPNSSIVDGLSTQVCGNLVRVFAWYDNEYAYSLRLVEFIKKISGGSF